MPKVGKTIRNWFRDKWIKPEEDIGVDEILHVTRNTMKDFKTETLAIVTANVLLVIFSYSIISNGTILKLSISTIFLITLLYTFYGLINHWRLIYEYLFVYKLNLKTFIYQKIHSEVEIKVKENFNNMAKYKNMVNDWLGKSQEEIIHAITYQGATEVIRVLKEMLGVFILLFILYHLYLKEILVEAYTGLSFYEILFYPFTLI